MSTGLVVDDNELLAATIQSVDAARHGDPLGAHRYRPLDADRLAVRVDPFDIALHHVGGTVTPGQALLIVAEAETDPLLTHQRGRRLRRAPVDRQGPPGGERCVDGGTEAVVRPRRALGRRRPVDVDEAIT